MSGNGFSDAERAAMQQRAEELRAQKGLKGAAKRAREYEACVEAIEGLTGTDSDVATLLHRIVSEEAPQLEPKTWYGFPTYAKDGKVVVFYQPATKFDTRYGTVSFEETAGLDEGGMWATSFAVVSTDDGVEQRLRELVRRATETL